MVKHAQKISQQQPTNCLSVFDHFVGLKLNGFIQMSWKNKSYQVSLPKFNLSEHLEHLYQNIHNQHFYSCFSGFHIISANISKNVLRKVTVILVLQSPPKQIIYYDFYGDLNEFAVIWYQFGWYQHNFCLKKLKTWFWQEYLLGQIIVKLTHFTPVLHFI